MREKKEFWKGKVTGLDGGCAKERAKLGIEFQKNMCEEKKKKSLAGDVDYAFVEQ